MRGEGEMILLFIILYALIAICVGYGYLIIEYKKHYKDEYSFSETLRLKCFDDNVACAVLIGALFPLALVGYLCWLIGRLIVKLIDKIVS